MMSNNLVKCLMNLRKVDMQSMAVFFDEKIPASWNKEKTACRLAEIYEQNSDAFLSMISLHIILFTREIHKKKQNGKLHAYYNQDENSMIINELCDALEPWGLIDYNKAKITVADVFIDAVVRQSVDMTDQLIEWQEMEYCARGIIETYGLVEEEWFFCLMIDCFPHMRIEDISAFILHRMDFLKMTIPVPIGEKLWFFNCEIDNPLLWYDTIQSRKDIAYRQYSKEEYAHAAAFGLPKDPKNMDLLVSLLCEKGIDEEAAEEYIMINAIEHSRELNTKFDLPAFLGMIEWESQVDFQNFLDLFRELKNDTPLWYNKGNTAEEIFGTCQSDGMRKIEIRNNLIEFPKRTKIGRNEPCPCGSGKKYKNCCERPDKDE